MRRALLIRQEEESLALSKLLQEKGVETCLHPLFTPLFFSLPSLKNPQGIIITSKNALRALEGRENLKEIPLFVVGDQTALFAKERGFLTVLSASGTSQELLHLILEKASPKKGILWHLSGDIVKGNIVETLKAKGFEAKQRRVYHIEEAKALPPSLLFDLEHQRISHILFFSPRMTTLFIHLLRKKRLEKVTCQMTALCLSQDVLKEALELEWKKVWVSSKPTLQDMGEYFDKN